MFELYLSIKALKKPTKENGIRWVKITSENI